MKAYDLIKILAALPADADITVAVTEGVNILTGNTDEIERVIVLRTIDENGNIKPGASVVLMV